MFDENKHGLWMEGNEKNLQKIGEIDFFKTI
jgi:hypothetical protein